MSQLTGNLTNPTTSPDTNPSSSPRLPRALLSVSREEFYGQDAEHQPLELTVRDGTTGEEVPLPDDLKGSVFIVSTVGCVASAKASPSHADTLSAQKREEVLEDEEHVVLPSKDGWTSLLNGDGMVYRLDFNSGKAHLSTRLVKTPSFHADNILHNEPEKYPRLSAFRNFGISRLSVQLGTCNQVNTAFVPMQFLGEPERLLVTWDMGRPYEIDPYSLKLVTPVGLNQDWQEMIKMPLPTPFRVVMNSAHPGFDFDKGEVFSVNVTKSFNTILQVSRLFPHDLKILLARLPRHSIWRKILQVATLFLTVLVDLLLGLFEFLGLGGDSGVHLVRWDGKDKFHKWQVVLPNGRPIKIKQTTHQIGLSENYIVFADTAFKIVVEDILPSLQKFIREAEAQAENQQDFEEKIISWLHFHRQYLTFPLLPYTKLYIVKRDQLAKLKPGESVKALPLKIKAEIAHFLVDYDDNQDKITLHAALNRATDFAEFIHTDDISVFNTPGVNPSLSEIAGVFVDALAVNRPAVYVIEASQGRAKTVHEDVLNVEESRQHTWSMGIYAYRDDQPTKTYEDIYWSSFGAWEETLSEFVLNLYKQYRHDRGVSLEEILQTTEKGVPAMLCRVHIERTQAAAKPTLSVADHFEFPPGYFANSPQFVPRGEGSTEGYLVCVVIHSDHFLSHPDHGLESGNGWSDKSEIWIFDAKDLRKGGSDPLYKLSHAKLNLGFTIHTTWLAEISPRPASDYDVREDFAGLVSQAVDYYAGETGEQIQSLFEEVYTRFEDDRG